MILFLLFFNIFISLRNVLYQACQFYSLSFSHLKKSSKQNTKQRTTKSILKEQNKWIDIEELVSTVDEEYNEVINLQKRTSIPCVLFSSSSSDLFR